MEAKNKALSIGLLETLAQSATLRVLTSKPKSLKILNGTGTDTSEILPLQNRAKKKMITQSVIEELINIAVKKGNEKLERAFRNTYFCQSKVVKHNGRLYGDYCKNRFCTVCAGVRKADIIHRYLPEIEKWEHPYFVTLTARAVKAPKLKDRIKRMFLSFGRLQGCLKKRYERGVGIKFLAIKSFECNFNPIKRTYNPHFHLIVESKELAEAIIQEWLKRCTKTHALSTGQDMRPIKNTTADKENVLIEIIKYGSKIFTDPTMPKGKDKKKKPTSVKIYTRAYYNIIAGMEGHRIFDRVGFNLPKTERVKQTALADAKDCEDLIFSKTYNDWISQENLDFLTGFEPTHELKKILENDIDTELQ